MSDALPPSPEAMQTLLGMTGLVEPWAVRVAATFRLADLMSDQGSAIEDLAAAADADPDALGRLLRFLVARDIFHEPSPGLFALNEPTRFLRADSPLRLRAWLDLDGAGGAMDRPMAWATIH